ncbi:MAG: 2OG-Fe(II) oxygenase [Pseudomonadales bacterium]
MIEPQSEHMGDNTTTKLAASTRGEQFDALERATRSGDSHAAARLGLRYLMAREVPADPVRGLELIEQAALAGDAQGNYLAATIASSSFWRERSWDEAFDYLMRAAEQGHKPSQSSLRILAGGPSGNKIEGENWANMRIGIDLAAWLAPPQIRMICEAPRIHVIENFTPPAACDWLITQAQGRLSRATIYDKATGGTIEDERRTNSQCDLGIETCGVLTFVIRGRIATITQRQDLAMEVPKMLHYAPGDTFAEHFDYLDPAEPAYATEIAVRGQRTDTFLIYLNEDFSGGETYFPRIGLSHIGAKGDALLFTNVDVAGAPDHDTMHAGLSPTSGEKWVFSQWIREFPRQ